MDPSVAPRTILAALAELAPAGNRTGFDATSGGAIVWLDPSGDPDHAAGREADRLAAIDVLHQDERLLRRGWGFLLGTAEFDGARRRVRLPLLTEPVRLRGRGRGRYRVVRAGDLELTPLVTDPALAESLETAASEAIARDPAGWFATLSERDWVHEVARAAGLPVLDAVGTATTPPDAAGLIGVARAGLYVARDVFSGSVRNTLLSWARHDGLEQTALAAVYGVEQPGEAEPEPPVDDEQPVRSPLPLNADQLEVVRRARRDRVTVVSGPPGNGKSHAVVAAALEVVDRGGSVLVATQSSHAADVLGELLDRFPGPTPVLFGDGEYRERIAATLTAGAATYDDRAVRASEQAVIAAAVRVRQLDAALDAALQLEQQATQATQWEPLLPALRAQAPGAFAPGADLSALAADAVRAAAPARTWRQRWLRRVAERRLRTRLRAAPSVTTDQLAAALDAARAAQAVDQLALRGGTDLAVVWQGWYEAMAALAEAVGNAMRHRAASSRRWTRAARRDAAVLASALRAGRNRRRQLLSRMDGAALVRALPLWVGTAIDADDLLPPVPGLFDLVILDEASHLDQLRAAPVLARARRALVVGDPRQLRFVSFVADVDVDAALRRHGLDERLDVRRMSAYDLAASAAPVIWLREHYRSVPHLIEFSAARFYQGRISVATRHPGNDTLDVIEVVQADDEVKTVVAQVRQLAGDAVTGIGVVTPFRAQAEALEAALVAEFPVDELARLKVRVGTVHAFQGSEADTVLVALGLTDTDPPGRVRFVADPQLFNVMVTRARRRLIVVSRLTAPDGLIGEYLAYAAAGPAPPPSGTPAGGWVAALAAELARVGLPVHCDYPVGRWVVDLCVGEAVGLICRVHPDGPAAHRDRQLTLSRGGWRLHDAYPSRWGGDAVRAALDLHSTLQVAGRPA